MILETITWMSVKTFFKKVLAWCKKYWQFLVGASIPIVIWVLTRDSSKLDEVVDRVKEDHEKEKDIINKAHEQEIQSREAAREAHKKRVEKIEKEHDQAQVDLTSRKKKKIKKIVEENKDNPEEITKKIAELTGINVHVD